ncbi:hypothetical protein FGE12_26485 [Aggregicoccus sp. 17bor-14]|uniref:hypothetical protein n=1 Tax=Myxococcaceae TaxID=31 RepID=UPI00129C5C51|nr:MULTISPECIES: hypothetical protein [Myxococcaceae]MBF5045988.1 hypothetical protein [Simulacricoccus sp. 17bor-14]MRI91719.1 hypothetical protein [Aggregicoccus sp. 17bor-14]
MRSRSRSPQTLPTELEPPQYARLICLRRSEDGGRVEKVGVEMGGVLKHYAPVSVLFALKVGAWRLRFVPPVGAGIDIEVGRDADGQERLQAQRGNALREDDGLSDVPACDHRNLSGIFDALR